MKLSKEMSEKLAELNRTRADLRLSERMRRLESTEQYFYEHLKKLRLRIEELERALQSASVVRQGNGQDCLRDLPATSPHLWKSDGS